MIEIGPENALDYLRSTGRLPENVAATVHPLAWGVSNVVLRIEPEHGDHFVLKQSREQLRTAVEWFSRVDRIYREIDAMQALQQLLPAGVVPRITFEDRDNYLFGMEAVAADHIVWKAELLAGRADVDVAKLAGNYLAAIHCRSHGDAALRQTMIDREVFDQLRIDPFYRRIAAAHSGIAGIVSDLIDQMLATPICLVSADFSPKNILVVRDADELRARLALVDFETAHYGDPAFDLGFFFSHLLLKGVLHANRAGELLDLARSFHTRYFAVIDAAMTAGPLGRAELDQRAVRHTAACMLSRIDGKSTVDYLPEPAQQDLVRRFSLETLTNPPTSLWETFDRLERYIG